VAHEKHLYNTTLGKVPGVRPALRRVKSVKPMRLALARSSPHAPQKTVEFQGRTLDCFYHRYNMTWASERCIEVPIAKSYLDQFPNGAVLEVGNVLSHYFPTRHDSRQIRKSDGIINRTSSITVRDNTTSFFPSRPSSTSVSMTNPPSLPVEKISRHFRMPRLFEPSAKFVLPCRRLQSRPRRVDAHRGLETRARIFLLRRKNWMGTTTKGRRLENAGFKTPFPTPTPSSSPNWQRLILDQMKVVIFRADTWREWLLLLCSSTHPDVPYRAQWGE